jgi:hypothetical protein
MGTFYARFLSGCGFSDECDAIRDAWRSGDRRGAVRAENPVLLDSCTLGSDPSLALSRAHQLRNEGIELPLISFPHGSSEDEILFTLRALAAESR